MNLDAPSDTVIDTNAWCGVWPPLTNTGTTVDELEAERKHHGITRMLVSPLEALLSEVPDAANDKLRSSLAGREWLEFVPVVNPLIAHWQAKVREYAEEGRPHRLRIAPSYHHYELTDEIDSAIAAYVSETKAVLSLQMRMEDERSQNPILAVEPPDLKSVAALAEALAPHPLIIHNLSSSEIAEISATHQPNILVDIAFAESFRTMGSLTERLPVERIVMGSNYPLFYLGAALAKIESWKVEKELKAAVLAGNIKRVLRSTERID